MKYSDELTELKKQLNKLEHQIQERYRGPQLEEKPIRQLRHITHSSDDPGYVNRILIATATTGSIRYEWVAARDNMVVPPNFGMVRLWQPLWSFSPIGFEVANAQNIIVREFLTLDFEWLLLYEHDVLPPHDAVRRFHHHMQDGTAPVISGLYYTRSRPSEPLIYRGRGTGCYLDWEFGDLVWADGIPTGFLLVHHSILRCMWDDAEEYLIQHPDGRQDRTRNVFSTPRDIWYDKDGFAQMRTGTSDLDWCERVMKGGYFKKAGWDKFQEMEFPFVVDTNIFCYHIDPDGVRYP